MPSVDFESLTRPISDSDPCGPDLDASGAADFLNFFASAESVLPQSYFRAREASGGVSRLFDPKMIAFDEYFETAKPFLKKTRDIRLIVLLAKFSILNRDLNGFVACLQALGTLLADYWDEVHPRAEGGDFTYRKNTLEAIDVVPTVTMPLQFLPIVQSRRFGTLSYRTYLTANGEVNPIEGEQSLDAAIVERILDECELAELVAAHANLGKILGAIEQIRQAWSAKSNSGQSLAFDQLATDAGAMVSWLAGVILRRNPSSAIASESLSSDDQTRKDDTTADAKVANAPKISSIAAAAAALAAVAQYFAKFEPSSPARLLINQSQQMLGKSFVEVLRMLVPAHAEVAAIQVGREHLLDLPVERMAATLNDTGEQVEHADQDRNMNEVLNRAQALAIIDQVSSYFRIAEPSSPIPVLLDRVRELGQRDFISLLRSVLPSDALRTPEN